MNYKFKEDVFFTELKDYINKTYGEHYVNNGEIQVVDVWHARGTLSTTAIDTALKYMMRYGKKDGKNKKDLFKAVHYIMLAMYTDGLLDNKDYIIHDEPHIEPTLNYDAHEHPTRGFPT